MSKNATVTAVVNQKGGTGKTTTCENLGVGLAMEGKKVLLIDTDPQASLTISLGNPMPDNISPTLSDMMGKIMNEQLIAQGEGVLHHEEGVDLMPSNIELSGLEVSLVNAMSRETILKQYIDTVKKEYDFILLDCMPSLGMLTVNALAAADNVLIPVQAAYLPAKGLEQLLQTINKVRRQINPKLKIEGILLTIVCAEHGLSIISPKPYRERSKRTLFPKWQTQRDILYADIDEILKQKPKDFEDFIQLMAAKEYQFQDGKQIAFKKKGAKRFLRLRSLGEGYSEEEIRAIISGKKFHKSRNNSQQAHPQKQFQMLIDIQEKLAEGKTIGYERWAKKYNRKEAAKTVYLLKEKGVGSYEELSALTDKLSNRFTELSTSIKTSEARIAEISVLKTHINNYAKTKPVYEEYRKKGYSKKFFEEHREEIQIHKAAKEAFNKLETKKLPTRKALDEEFHKLLTEKKQAYAEYRQIKKDMQEYLIARQTVESILGIDKKKEEEKKKNITL